MKQLSKLHIALTGIVALGSSWAAHAAQVNLYTTREPVLIQPLLQEFSEKQVSK